MLAHALGRQLARPSGWGGWLVGHAMRVANKRPTHLAVEALGIEPGDTVLDLGCGPGEAIAWMTAHSEAREIHGIDASPLMVEQATARNRGALRDGRVVLGCGDFHRLPYPDARFDRLLASNVLYFFDDLPAIFAELRRVLRPGGRIAIYVTEAETMQMWPFAVTGTHRLFSIADLSDALAEAGFGREQIHIARVPVMRDVFGLVATVSC